MKSIKESILDIDDLEKKVDEKVAYSVVDYIDKSYRNVGAFASTEWPLLWDDTAINNMGDHTIMVNFDWASFSYNERERVSAVMNEIFGRVYYDEKTGKFHWFKTEAEIKKNIINWIIPHLNDMGRYMIRKYKPRAEYFMCDHFHEQVHVIGQHQPFNNAHLTVFMNDTVLFHLLFNAKPTKDLQIR